MKYFRFHPKVEYSDNLLTNIAVRAKIREAVKNVTAAFYSYVIKDGEYHWVLAHKYYGSPDLTWLIFYANDMMDPYYDWIMFQDEFLSYIRRKYGDIESPMQEIHQYYNARGYVIDETSYLALPAEERSSISVFDYEVQLNEAKREIVLLDNDYALRVVEELKEIFK